MIDITQAVVDFYGLQAIDSIKRVEEFRHSHERWLRDFTAFKENYEAHLARAMFDYLVKACFGEARHGAGQCGYHIEGVPIGGDRGDAIEEAARYDPRDILKKCAKLFGIRNWSCSYGGERWKHIAESALLYFSLPSAAYIDHCVDLSHNNSVAYDKREAGIFRLQDKYEYRDFLNYKMQADPIDLLKKCTFSKEIARLLERAINLGIVPHVCIWAPETSVIEVMQYEGVEWGDEYLGSIIEYREDDYEDEEEEEESYEEYDCDFDYNDDDEGRRNAAA